MAETAVAEKNEQDQAKVQAQSAEFGEANGFGASGAPSSIDILLDIGVPVTVTLGKNELTIEEFLKLGPGSVLEMDKPIDAPADLYVKGVKFATGSIVVVNGKFAVRIDEILGAQVTDSQLKPQE
jgi:flagellar motor switch protein FliN/FliY